MVMPQCSDGVTDMFPAQPWDLKMLEQACMAEYGVAPQPYLVETMYGGKNISAHSNIVFRLNHAHAVHHNCSWHNYIHFPSSNGLLDPWHGGGVLQDVSDTLVAVIIPDGAHHLDLRASQTGDPKSVIQARLTEIGHIMKWINQYDKSTFY